ncbi:hypothetical protein [Mesorhizobium sp. M0208]
MRGRFIWPSAADGTVVMPAQLGFCSKASAGECLASKLGGMSKTIFG